MKEYIVTYNKDGRRCSKRIFAYHMSDAYKRLKEDEGNVSIINSKAA